MPAGGISTFDGNPNAQVPTSVGYRPGAPDFNGAALVDDTVYPPDPQTMPTAALFNTIDWTIVSLGKMCEVGTFAVTAGSSPIMTSWQTAANLITTNPFTLIRNGVGDYTIEWAANTFPITGQPRAWLNAILGAHAYAIGIINLLTGVRVTTVIDGALADIPFSVALY